VVNLCDISIRTFGMQFPVNLYFQNPKLNVFMWISLSFNCLLRTRATISLFWRFSIVYCEWHTPSAPWSYPRAPGSLASICLPVLCVYSCNVVSAGPAMGTGYSLIHFTRGFYFIIINVITFNSQTNLLVTTYKLNYLFSCILNILSLDTVYKQ